MITRRVGGAADATPGEAGARRGHGIAKSPSGDSSPRRVRGRAQRKSNLPAQMEQYMRHPGDAGKSRYSVTVMSWAGLSGAQANAADAVMRVAGLLAALISAAFIDRRGRMFVLKIGTFGAFLSLYSLACLFASGGLDAAGTVPARLGTVSACCTAGIAVAVLLCLFVAFFSFSPGVCVWVIAAEMLPAPVRAKGMSFALLGNQLVTMGIASVFLPAATRFGCAPIFFVFALATAAYFGLAVFLSRGRK